jgi:nitroreductase
MSYLQFFTKPIDEIIKIRTSCRTFKARLLGENDKKELLEFARQVNRGIWNEKIAYQLHEFNAIELKNKKMSTYGLIRNARSFLIGMIDKVDSYQMSYGYAVEHIVLKATELGIGTCWTGYYDPYVIKDVKKDKTQAIPAVIIVGYASEQQNLLEKIARFAIRASRRHDWNRQFFSGDFATPLSVQEAGSYSEALEMLRLAPSSGNTQPWRIVKETNENTYHFFKKVVNQGYEKLKLHDIDIGIAMCHFELGAAKNGLNGHWVRQEPKTPYLPRGTEYMVSWMHLTPRS